MRPHLLLTAWAFPPARTSGVYRARALANAFRAAGWDVTVICGPSELFESNGVVDQSLRRGLASGIRLVEVPLELPELATDVFTWSWLRARHPELWLKLRLRRDQRAFPEPFYGSWAPAIRRAAGRVHATHPVTLALGTSAPNVDFVPGEHLYRTHGVPYVMDYRDAWSIDAWSGGATQRATPRVEAVERRLMENASEIWFVNEPIRSWHVEKYPAFAQKMHVVSNGFDVVDGVSPAVPFREPGSFLTFGYIGTITNVQFPTEAVLAGWKLARERSEEIANARLVLRGYLGRTGVADHILAEYLERASQHAISYEGPVPKAEVQRVYAEFDALVLGIPSGPGVTSGKALEYAATGLPTISVHDPLSAASDVLRGSPVWVPTRSMDAEDIASAFIESVDVIRNQTARTRQDAIEWGARWERTRQLDPAIARLTKEFGGAKT